MVPNHENCSPNAASIVNSLRAFGYDFATAIADIVDNSIFAGARNVSVDFSWNDGDPWFRIVDDGEGMTEKVLREAMRLGSKNPREKRAETDLGRFGLGMKTAAFSQCKLLTVRSKTRPRNAVIRCWDLDHIEATNKWDLRLSGSSKSHSKLSALDSLEHGTVVLCENLDRVVSQVDDPNAEDNFLSRFRLVADYLEVVFHRFLTGRPKLNIKVGNHQCVAWDPFLEQNDFTQERSMERIDKRRVAVTPFVLPHVSHRSLEENRRGGGINGWNAHQGFYVYRNRRMIIAGGYLDFDFKCEEHYKLCRIRIDLPNNLDHEWGIDVRKASASPPSHVRSDLERIAKSTRNEACEIYRTRAGVGRTRRARNDKQAIWNRVRRGDKVLYNINRENDVLNQFAKLHGISKKTIDHLFHLIEKSVPHRSIVIDNSENEDCLVDLPPEVEPPPKELIAICEKMFRAQLRKTNDPHEAAKVVCLSFPPQVGYRAHLDKLIEEIKGNE